MNHLAEREKIMKARRRVFAVILERNLSVPVLDIMANLMSSSGKPTEHEAQEAMAERIYPIIKDSKTEAEMLEKLRALQAELGLPQTEPLQEESTGTSSQTDSAQPTTTSDQELLDSLDDWTRDEVELAMKIQPTATVEQILEAMNDLT